MPPGGRIGASRRRTASSEIARNGNAAIALSHHAWAGDSERKKYGPDRAKGGGDRRGGNCAAHFRAHDCRSWTGRSRTKKDEMAADRDRSGQAMRTKLAAPGTPATETEGFLFPRRQFRSSFDRVTPTRRHS